MKNTQPEPCFLIDEAFHIEGTGTIVTGVVLKDIEVGKDVWIVSDDSVEGKSTILDLEVIDDNIRESIKKANAGQSVGVLIDFPKEMISKHMCLFIVNDEMALPPWEELVVELKAFSQETLEEEKDLIKTSLLRYIEPLRIKESQLVHIDDYGDYNFDLWFDECDSFINTKLHLLKSDLIEKSRIRLEQVYKNKMNDDMLSTCKEYMEIEIHGLLVEEIQEGIKEL